jgi:hypothetical protein
MDQEHLQTLDRAIEKPASIDPRKISTWLMELKSKRRSMEKIKRNIMEYAKMDLTIEELVSRVQEEIDSNLQPPMTE